MKRFLAALLFIHLAFFGFSQSDPRIEALWEKYQAVAEAAATSSDMAELKDTDVIQTVVTTSMTEGDERFESVLTTVLDRTNRLMITVSENNSADYTFSSWMRYDDGELLMYTTLDGETEQDFLDAEAEEDIKAAFEQTLDWIDSFSDEETLLELANAVGEGRYDGVQRYGNVLEGEQITLDASPIFAGLPDMDIGEMSMVFTPEGHIAGQVIEFDGQRLISVFDPPTALMSDFSDMSYKMYSLEGDEVTFLSDFRMEATVNPELDLSFFEPPVVDETQ